MDSLLTDLRQGARSLLRTPLATGLAALSLALGIAVVETLFTAVNAFILRPLDAPAPHELVTVYGTDPQEGASRLGFSWEDLQDYRREVRSISLAGYRERDVNLSGTLQPEQLPAIEVTGNVFRVLGVAPELGRGFLPEEEGVGGTRTVVLGSGLWLRRFGADPGVLGSTVRLDGIPHTVVGIMPKKTPMPFNFVEVWTPAQGGLCGDRSHRVWSAVGRIHGGEFEEGRRELTRFAATLAEMYPATHEGIGAGLHPLRDDLFGDDPKVGSLILMVAGLLVLLIACANAVNILLAKALRRSRELAVRSALGAPRRRLVQQLLTESLLLGLLGGALGTLAAVAGVRGILTLLPPVFGDIVTIDLRVLGVTTAVALGAGILVGILPALQGSRQDLRGSLADGGARGTTTGGRRGRLRKALVVSQVAFTLVLLVSSALLFKSLFALGQVDMGFRTEGILTFGLRLPGSTYVDDDAVNGFYERVTQRLGAVPGVDGAAVATRMPMGGERRIAYRTEGEEYPEGREPRVPYRGVSPEYFGALEVPLLEGRTFETGDRPGAPPVVVVSQSLADLHWAQGGALGKRIHVLGETREVVGVVMDVRNAGPLSSFRPALYLPSAQVPDRTMEVAIRTAGDPSALTPAVRNALGEIDADQPMVDVRTMDDRIRQVLVGEIIMPRISGGLGLFALLLSIVGIYGVMAHTVGQRMREAGIRIALGATPRDVVGMVLRQGSYLLLAGVGFGLFLGILATQALRSFLYGVAAFDPLIFAGIPVLLLSVGTLAAYVPARRATRADPVECMRRD
jgi:predicted permease